MVGPGVREVLQEGGRSGMKNIFCGDSLTDRERGDLKRMVEILKKLKPNNAEKAFACAFLSLLIDEMLVQGRWFRTNKKEAHP